MNKFDYSRYKRYEDGQVLHAEEYNALVTDVEEDLNELDRSLTESVVDYKAGNGISLENDTFSLKSANSDQLGGIKTGYTENGNNYGVRVDNMKNAYVTVPKNSDPNTTPNTVDSRLNFTSTNLEILDAPEGNSMARINWSTGKIDTDGSINATGAISSGDGSFEADADGNITTDGKLSVREGADFADKFVRISDDGSVIAKSFKIGGKSDDSVILAGGGTVELSSIVQTQQDPHIVFTDSELRIYEPHEDNIKARVNFNTGKIRTLGDVEASGSVVAGDGRFEADANGNVIAEGNVTAGGIFAETEVETQNLIVHDGAAVSGTLDCDEIHANSIKLYDNSTGKATTLYSGMVNLNGMILRFRDGLLYATEQA